jgi:hypothetical protein
MAQFQTDTDARTTGDGHFVLTAPADSIIDAPPRDARYFRDHLLFLERYYERVSGGKLIIRSTLIDPVVTLGTVMGTYSPARNASNKPVADLARDTWRAVDSLGLVADFTPYTVFVVFHAGVGRDIDLVSLLGYDPTPLDIPSLYIGPQALKEFYGEDFAGFPVQGGTVLIANSIILPETETRAIPGIGGDVTIELGTNGLLCASFGNAMGLPDLFNTETGTSGIGRFGLMDGQSIFSFSGAFPPEPSAWEKMWLGWLDPIDVPAGTSTLVLPAASVADTAYRIPIGASEYYLVENRNRDARRDGQRIVSVFNGQERTQFFARDTAGFDAFDISALAGSITDVDDYDWSIPGGVTEEGEFYDGGTLIWQIDEEVIAQAIGSNAVNANPSRKGVRVVEADGSQDIGQDYGMFDPGSGSQDGTALDFWFNGNSAPVYKNEFSGLSQPPAISNAGADPHLVMSGFSARGPRMTVQVSRGSASFSPVAGFPKYLGAATTGAGLSYADPGLQYRPVLFVTTGVTPAGPIQNDPAAVPPPQASVRAFALDGSPALSSSGPSGVVTTASGGAVYSGQAAVYNAPTYVVTPVSRSAQIPGYMLITELAPGAPGDTLGAVVARIDLDRTFATPAIFSDTLIAVADESDSLYLFSRFGVPAGSVLIPLLEGERVAGLCSKPWLDFTLAARGVIVTGDMGTVARIEMTPAGPEVQTVRRVGRPIVGPAATLFSLRAADGAGEVHHGFVTSDGYVYLVDESFVDLPSFPVRVGDSISTPAAYADLNRDNSRDIVVFSGNRIHALSRAGSSLDYFPVTLTGDSPLASPPVVGDIAGTDISAVLGVTMEGLVVAYDGQGRMVSGFPLLAGRGPHTAAIVSGTLDSTFVAVASAGDGSLSLWRTGGPSTGNLDVPYWPQYQADGAQSGLGFLAAGGAPVSSEYFPPSRAYNWPNPAYDGRTFIRYFVGETSSVRIKIFDTAGDLVKEMSGPGVAGMDNEVEWDVSDVQSGVYFARIEAQAGGQSGSTTVKIAIVK